MLETAREGRALARLFFWLRDEGIYIYIFFDTVPLKYLFLWTWRDWVCLGVGKILSRKDLELKSYGIRT